MIILFFCLHSTDATEDDLMAGIKKAVRTLKSKYADNIKARNIKDLLSTEVKLVSIADCCCRRLSFCC